MPLGLGQFPVYFGGDSMPTSFVAADYVAGLQTLLDRHEVAATVHGFSAGRNLDKLEEPAVELMIESMRGMVSGELRTLDGVITANLLVMRRLDAASAETDAFELALDVATALRDETQYGETPVLAAGPIDVTGIEPEPLEGPGADRVSAFLITYEQEIRIRRTNTIPEPAQPTSFLVSRAPDIGTGNEGSYRQIVPEE